MGKIRVALISVSDKTGVADLAKRLKEDFGVHILSTGGTAKALREAGLAVIEVSDYTGFPEMFDGRVKTLHPKIHGGLLYRRDNAQHCKDANEYEIAPIDMVVINLYPFQKTIAKPGCTLEEAIENIDIGGPAMLRAAAKNWPDVTVLTDSRSYEEVLSEMRANEGCVSKDTNFRLAATVFQLMRDYDGAIADYLEDHYLSGKEVSK